MDWWGEVVWEPWHTHRKLSGGMVHSGTHQEESLYRYECGYVSCENVGDVGIVGSQARCVSSDFFERRCDGGKSTSVGATGRLGSKRCAQITKML